MMKKVVVAAIALAGLGCFPAQPAQAQVTGAPVVANHFYVTVKGIKQGDFKGEVLVAGPAAKNAIAGVKFLMQESSPRDAVTGLPSGRKQYSPIIFTKMWGPSSPQFLTALSTNEVLTTVKFEFPSVARDGKETITQTITLTNANISNIRRYIGGATAVEAADPRQLEDISFTFQKIELDDAAAGVSAIDNWNAMAP